MTIGHRDVEICMAYKGGESIDSIARRFPQLNVGGKVVCSFMSTDAVKFVLQQNRVKLRPKPPPKPCPGPKDPTKRNEEILARRAAGFTYASIGKAFGLTKQRIERIIATDGAHRDLPNPERDLQICNLYAGGTLTQAQIGERFGLSSVRISTIIRKHKAQTEQILEADPELIDDPQLAFKVSIRRRATLRREIGDDPRKQDREREHCRRDIVRFIKNWGWTYDPRAVTETWPGTNDPMPAWLPFDLFPRQVELVRFFEAKLSASEDGLVEKSRDIGFTWLVAAFAVHRWLFVPGFQTLIGANLEVKVDSIGNPDSIFEKIRLFHDRLPAWLQAPGFYRPEHDNFMRIVNPDNGNVISGAAGDQIGRGGRATVVFLDEAAFLLHADSIEAATLAIANCRIWGSSVNGLGNLFARKRHGGALRPDQIFTFRYKDNPRWTPERVEKKRRETSSTPWVWASEMEIDYSASVEGVCIPGKWVEASRRLLKLLEANGVAIFPNEPAKAGLDIGGGKAESVVVIRRGPLVSAPETWGTPDTTETAHRALSIAAEKNVAILYFDSVGIGQGVSSVLSLNQVPGITTTGINSGVQPSGTIWPDGQFSRQKFANLKAELWWLMRERFRLTFEHVNFLEGEEEDAAQHELMDLIALPEESVELARQLSLPCSFRNERGRIMIETKKQLATRGIASPDQADALALTFVPGDNPIMAVVPIIIEGGMPDRWAVQWT